MEELDLIRQIAIALGLGFAGGLAARLAGLSPIVGYLFAGILISPFTPGYEGDVDTLMQVAEIGIIFLMFGVGLHFSMKDLLRVRGIAIAGAVLQMTFTTLVGLAVATGFGLSAREGLVLGLAISISSTVVVIRTLEDRGLQSSVQGRVAIGWLIVQDLATVFILAILPALEEGSPESFAREAAKDIALATVFVTAMLVAGARLIPHLLTLVARTGSRELFILGVVATALGIATGAAEFGLSLALGAFVGGVAVSESEISHQAAADVVPLREAFAVLFFVSVGMLLDPGALADHAGLVAAVVAVVMVAKGLGTAIIAAAFPYPARTALTVGAGLAQIGEFSFVISREGLDSGLLSEATNNVVLAVAVISITLNPATFAGVGTLERALKRTGPLWLWADRQGDHEDGQVPAEGHVVIAGYGRVGQLTGHALGQLALPMAVVELNLDSARRLVAAGIPAVWGDAASEEVLRKAGVQHARLVVIAVPDETTALLATTQVRKLNPAVPIVLRGRDAGEVQALRQAGATEVIVPEYEGGLELMRQTLVALGFDAEEALHFSHAVRDIHYGEDTGRRD